MLTQRQIVYNVQVVKNWVIRRPLRNVLEEAFYPVLLILPTPIPSFAEVLMRIALESWAVWNMIPPVLAPYVMMDLHWRKATV